MKRPTTLIIALVLAVTVVVVSSLFLASYPNQFRHRPPVLVSGVPCAPNSSNSSAGREEPGLIRILVGILTLPDRYERRHLLRHAYALQRPDFAATARIDVRFVFCSLTTEEQQVLVAMEIMVHGDIIILDCAENMNGGKTFAYFSSLPRIFADDAGGGAGRSAPPYDYVMKADDDVYFRLGNLAASLRATPRVDVYYGFLLQCDEPNATFRFMSGMGYALSWDLVEWIAKSEAAAAEKDGPEDVMTGRWLVGGGKGKNRIDMNPAMYDYPAGPPVCYRHELVPDTVAVHMLKGNLEWARTLKYFNVTMGLKPSKLYHIP